MIIRTPEDWFKLADKTIGRLPDYASEFMTDFDADKATGLLKAAKDSGQEPDELHSMFETLWSELPDHPAIHTGPFNDLCDLCSEYWVFQEP